MTGSTQGTNGRSEPRPERGRFSSRRKAEAVLRLLHGEELDAVGRQNLMWPTDTHDANLLAPACCRLAGSAYAAPACVPPESRAPMTDAAASRCSAGRTHQAPASAAVR